MEASSSSTGIGIDRQAVAKTLESVHQRRRRRDRIPGSDGGAGVDAAERCGGVAIDNDVAGRGVHLFDAQRQRAAVLLLRVVVAELDRLHVAVHQLRLLRVGLGQELADNVQVDPAQGGQRAGVADVLHQDAGANAGEILVAQARERNPQHGNVIAQHQRRTRPGGVVEKIAARGDLLEVAHVGLDVQGDHDVDLSAAGAVAIAGHADLVPGGQALDVGREVILAHHRHTAPEYGLHQQAVGAGRASAVDGGNLDDEVVYAIWRCVRHAASPSPAWGH